MFTVGIAFTVMIFEATSAQPLAFVPVTVNVDVEPGLTVILDVVAPLLQT